MLKNQGLFYSMCYGLQSLLLVCNKHSFLSYHQEIFNYKIAARPDRRRQFEKELAAAIEVALSILTACLKINEFKEQVSLSCGFYVLDCLLVTCPPLVSSLLLFYTYTVTTRQGIVKVCTNELFVYGCMYCILHISIF